MIGIIDYQGGNIGSLSYAVEALGYNYKIISSNSDIDAVEKIIMPGQGRAGAALAALEQQQLLTAIRKTTKPFLGICLGMQLLYQELAEDSVAGLGIFAGKVIRFDSVLPCPQIGWNTVEILQENNLFQNLPKEIFLYFANSYYAASNSRLEIASYQYKQKCAAAIEKNNFYGVQFHPEKSGNYGYQILRNFIELC